MFENDLYDPMQSAYQKYHSTQTALVKVHNDIMEAIDGGSCVILVLLDLSAAFDTVDHEILLHRLGKRLGVTSSALLWFKFYLSSHTHRVDIKVTSSDDCLLTYGVPQGSVHGPKLFKLYSSCWRYC